ncbi:hypothetical protein [Paractinoplanes durhamensis]|uniref:hypothetical protein n=1 Tax=Paractinoplanes durhamensis TaxID=113563 RepID=UPI003638E908
MTTLLRSELYRMATIRSSWVSIALFGFLAAAFGILDAHFWALFAALGAFGIAALTIAQHHQHRTIALLYLARPNRLTVLFAQVITTVLVSEVFAVLTGITVRLKDGNGQIFTNTLIVVPVMAVFAAAVASIVRRASWMLMGFAAWFVIVEGLVGKLEWHLPISAFLKAAAGDGFGLEVFIVWAVTALGVAVLTLPAT